MEYVYIYSVMIWLLHGNMGLPSDWEPVSLELQRLGLVSRTLNLWKLLACCPKTLEEAGDLVAAEIASQDRSPILCGYSLGGRIALHAVCRNPEMWKGAVFISTHPGLLNDEERAVRRASDVEWAFRCLHQPWLDVMEAWHSQGVLAGNKRTDQPVLSSWKKSIARAFMEWSLGTQADFRSALKQFLVPFLWICGEKDGKFTGLAGDVVGKALISVPGAGHRIPAEQPVLLAGIIAQFVKSLNDE